MLDVNNGGPEAASRFVENNRHDCSASAKSDCQIMARQALNGLLTKPATV